MINYGSGRHLVAPVFYPRIAFSCLTIALGAVAVLMGGQSLRQLALGFSKPVASEQVFGTLGAMGILLAVIAFARTYNTTLLASGIVGQLKHRLLQKSLSLQKTSLDRLQPGAIFQVWQGDFDALEGILSRGAPIFLRSILQLLGAAFLFIHASPQLALMTVLLVLSLVVPFRILLKYLKNLTKTVQEHQSRRLSYLQGVWSRLSLVQALGAQGDVVSAYDAYTLGYHRSFKRRLLWRSLLVALIIATVFGALLLLLHVGRNDILAGTMSMGDLLAFAYYAIVMGGSLNAVAEHFGDLQQSFLSLERVKDFLALDAEPVGGASPGSDLTLDFNTVCFAYAGCPDKNILENLTFQIPMGTSVGLVGPSGGGKTTLLSLLMGFYQPTSGDIKVGGHDLGKIDLALWRRHVFWISQESLILPGTLKQNLCFGLESFPENVLCETLGRVGLGNLLSTLTQGLETWIGEGGQNLSGGEKQRLALARALLADRPILLFDEPTSALDATSEYLMTQELLPLFKTKTCLIVAHRLSSLRGVQKILVLDQGRLVAMGTHEDLVTKDGLYQQFVHHQTNL